MSRLKRIAIKTFRGFLPRRIPFYRKIGNQKYCIILYPRHPGEWELVFRHTFHLQNALNDFVQKEDTVLDIGAKMGLDTVGFAHRVGPKGKVLAFEYDAYLRSRIEETIQCNRFENVNVYGEELLMLDQFTSEKVIENVDVVKIDVEGLEDQVLNNMERMLLEQKPIMVVEIHQFAHSPTSIGEFLSTFFCRYSYRIKLLYIHHKEKSIVFDTPLQIYSVSDLLDRTEFSEQYGILLTPNTIEGNMI